MNSQIPPEVSRFVDVARRYCAWVEREATIPLDLIIASRLLAELQLTALGLPELSCGDYQGIPQPDRELKDSVLARASTVAFHHYWDTFDPLKENEEPVCPDLPDDLADIWLDLWTGLHLFDSGYALDANFHWKVLYDSHWRATSTGCPAGNLCIPHEMSVAGCPMFRGFRNVGERQDAWRLGGAALQRCDHRPF